MRKDAGKLQSFLFQWIHFLSRNNSNFNHFLFSPNIFYIKEAQFSVIDNEYNNKHILI